MPKKLWCPGCRPLGPCSGPPLYSYGEHLCGMPFVFTLVVTPYTYL